MRIVIIFFLSLCFFLLKGESSAHAGSHHYRPWNFKAWNFSNWKAEKKQPLRYKSSHRHETVKEYFLNIEDEDEDVCLIKKQVQLVRYFITIAYAFVLSHLLINLKRLSFGRYLVSTSSYKYIKLRVLRI